MPTGKKTGATLYTLIIFVAISIIGVALAVLFFIQAASYKSQAQTLQSQTDDLATSAELRKIGSLVGDKQQGKSRLGTMVDFVDETTQLITGKVSEDMPAQSKVNEATLKVKETVVQLAAKHKDINLNDANSAALIPVIEKLSGKLENTANAAAAAEQQFNDLQKRFNDAIQNSLDKEKALSEEKEKAMQQVVTIQKDYSELKSLLEKSATQQVKTLSAQLETEKTTTKQLNQDVLKSEAELKMAQDKIKRIQESLNAVVPPPDAEVAAYKIDGRVLLLDEKSKTVFINVGSADHVYQGLTFAIYDKNTPLPKNGKGKAEIEVYNVGKNVSTARITQSDPKNPIIVDDAIANLVWDSSKTNVFVVTGEFNLGDENPEVSGAERIKALIERWGGKVDEKISVDTDFVVLGNEPQRPKKPTFEETEADPAALEKYEAALKGISQYDEILKQAQTLSVPIFNMERFLYFIGYKSQADRPGAF